MSLLEQIKNKARTDKKTIVLAEGHDPRTVKAAAIVRDEKIADIVILGNEEQIRSFGEDLTGVKIIDPAKSEWLEDFADTYYEMRKAKGMTPEKAMELMKTDVLVFGAMMVKKGKVDGMVAGAVNSTSNVIRAAVTIIKMAPGIKYASSCFIMESPYPEFGDNGKNGLRRLRLCYRSRCGSALRHSHCYGQNRPRCCGYRHRRWPCFPSLQRAAQAIPAWIRSFRLPSLYAKRRPTCLWTASFRWMPLWCPPWANSKAPAAPLRDMPMC